MKHELWTTYVFSPCWPRMEWILLESKKAVCPAPYHVIIYFWEYNLLLLWQPQNSSEVAEALSNLNVQTGYRLIFKTACSPPKTTAYPAHLFASAAAQVYNSILWRYPFFQIPNASCMHCWSETRKTTNVYRISANSFCGNYSFLNL